MPATKKRTSKKTKPARKTMSAKKKSASRASAARRPKASAAKSGRSSSGFRMTEASPAFTVDDLSRSMGWYRDVLGFAVEEKWERDGVLRGVSLRAGDVSLMLAQDDWQKGRDRRKGEGFRIYFSTAQDVDGLAAGIKARGGTLDSEPADMPWGSRDFSLTDPDGFKLTIGRESARR